MRSMSLVGLIISAGVLAAGATLLGFLGRLGWWLDLFAHFRVQYFVGLSIVTILLLVMRRLKTAAGFGVLALVNLSLIVPLYVGPVGQARQDEQPVRAMLINVNTRSGVASRVAVLLREVNPDILVLEEISSRWLSDLEEALKEYPHSCVQPRDDNFGIGLFSRYPLEDPKVVYIGDAEVPSIAAIVNVRGADLFVLATHPVPPIGAAYSRWRNNQLGGIPEFLPNDGSPILLLGDLNVSPWSPHFRDLLRNTGLRDSAKGWGLQTSWPAGSRLFSIPIDHCLHSADVAVVAREVGTAVGSDHYPLRVDFVIRAGNGKGR